MKFTANLNRIVMDGESAKDSLVCGLCQKDFVNVLDFITHKAQHVGPGKGLGCEFCGTSYTRQVTIREHYRRKHKIFLTAGPENHREAVTIKHKTKKNLNSDENDEVDIDVECDVVLVEDDKYNERSCMESAVHTTGMMDGIRDVHIAIVQHPDYVCMPFTGGPEEAPNNIETVNSFSEINYGSINQTKIPVNQVDAQLQQLPEELHKSVVQEPCGSVTLVEEPHGSVTLVEEPQDSIALVEEPHMTMALAEEVHESVALVDPEVSHGSVTLIQEPHGSVTVVEEPSGSVSLVEEHERIITLDEEHHSALTLVEGSSDPVTFVEEPECSTTVLAVHDNLESSSDNIIHLPDNLINSADNSMGLLVTALEANEMCSLNTENQALDGVLESNPGSVTANTDVLQTALVSSDGMSLDSEMLTSGIETSVGNPELLQTKMTCSISPLSTVNHQALSQGINSCIDDFYFILMTNMHKGSSFSYGKHCFKCLHCDYKTCWKSALCKHMTSKHEEIMKIHKCIETKSVITDENQKLIKFSEFVATHQFSKARKTSKRVRGVEKQDLPGNYSCTKCKKVFSRLRYLRKHMTVHKMEQKFLCDECGKAFKTKTYLNSHRRTHKRDSYKCSQCDFSSTINAAIHAHRQLHNDGSVLCEICGYAYTDRSTLTKHKKVHDLSRPFACKFPGCTWRFKTEVMCVAHYKAHTTEGKFKCLHCGYVFRHKHHLQRHEEKMHGIERTKLSSRKQQERANIENTVRYIVNSVENDVNPEQTRLQTNQLVIATDADGNTVNYQVADIMTNVAYQTLLQGQNFVENTDAQTIYTFIPTEEQEQIVYQPKNEVATE